MARQDGEAIRSLLRTRKNLSDIESPLTFRTSRSPALTSVSMAMAERTDRPRPDLISSLTAVEEPKRYEGDFR